MATSSGNGGGAIGYGIPEFTSSQLDLKGGESGRTKRGTRPNVYEVKALVTQIKATRRSTGKFKMMAFLRYQLLGTETGAARHPTRSGDQTCDGSQFEGRFGDLSGHWALEQGSSYLTRGHA